MHEGVERGKSDKNVVEKVVSVNIDNVWLSFLRCTLLPNS